MYLQRNSGIILALDLTDERSAFNLVKAVFEDIDAIKIGYPLILNTGIGVIRKIKTTFNIPVIADLKIADIPFIAKLITKIAIENLSDGIIIHGFMGPDGIEACIQEAGGKMIFVTTELTNPGGEIFTRLVAEDICRIALELGAYGIQAPGTRPERIKRFREIVGKKLKIIACGIGAQGPKPGTAIKAGADFEIIGRAIYNSLHPNKEIKKIKEEIKRAILGDNFMENPDRNDDKYL